jgi:hypothetical protein
VNLGHSNTSATDVTTTAASWPEEDVPADEEEPEGHGEGMAMNEN